MVIRFLHPLSVTNSLMCLPVKIGAIKFYQSDPVGIPHLVKSGHLYLSRVALSELARLVSIGARHDL